MLILINTIITIIFIIVIIILRRVIELDICFLTAAGTYTWSFAFLKF